MQHDRSSPSAEVDPVYVLFEDLTHVNLYRRSFFDVVEDDGARFDGFSRVDWFPQRGHRHRPEPAAAVTQG
jgi:hypothetical protein